VRVTAGKHRSRKLAVPAGRDVRPTSDRARQALFNILEHGGFVDGGGSPIRDAHVLDAFAGSGALGLEALSRGAASATFMETAAPALDAIRHNVEACREEDKTEILRADATRPPRARTICNIAFLDPPYHKGLAAPALTALADAGWLAEATICCVELAADENFTPPEGFEPLDERRYGAARIVLLRRIGDRERADPIIQ
jgi:16S rRNA (guanine966-N2)-methyltransferase